MRLKILFFLMIIPFLVKGIDFETSGYVKYLFSGAKLPFIQKRLNDHLLHARLNTRWYVTSDLSFSLETRWRTYYGQSVEDIPDFKERITHDYEFSDLGWELIKKNRLFSFAEIDRLYLDYQAPKWQITLGRQRIAWGTSLVWNIIDLFNPMSILDFDYEERPGSDAVRFQYFTGSLSRIEFAYQPAPSNNKQIFALLWATHYGEYDLFFLAGMKHHRKTAGFAWTGYIKDAGFRGEFRVSDPLSEGPQTPAPLPELPSLTNDKRISVQGVLSFDYSFPNSFYVHSELLYNRNGRTRNAGFYQLQAAKADMLTPAKWSLFQEFAYDFHPLVRGDVFVFYNPDDRSGLIAPSVSWSVFTNVDLYLIGFVIRGKSSSEFGAMGNAGFLRLKYSF
ncbi:MAG: hypothetical protein GXO77_08445 [Calditrichaeota bacterium]|nr:hypothetical protein [Calditrichota bacterium]